MGNTHALPFSIDATAISQWLDSLNLKQAVQTANDIYAVLKTLNKSPVQYQHHLPILLDALTPITVQLCTDLQPLFCTADDSLDAKKRKIARLSINSLRYLAFLHYQLTLNTENNHIALYINRCIKICDLCLTQSALIYERPSQEIWKIVGQMYQLSSDKALLELLNNDSTSFFNQQDTISKNIKTVLLFNLCKPYYLKQNEILRLHTVLNQYSEQLKLNNQYTETCTHSWDYSQPSPAKIIRPSIDTEFSTLYLDNQLLRPTLQAESFSAISTKLTTYRRLIPNISKERGARQKIAYGISAVYELIEQHKRTRKIRKTSEHLLSLADKLELQPFDYEKKLEKVSAADIWKNNKALTNTTHIAQVKEDLDSDFLLVKLNSFSGTAEDIIIIDGENKLQLGVIRLISQLKNEKQSYQLLVEKISSELKATTVINQSQIQKAITCKIPNNETLLLVAPNKYSTASTIELNQQAFILTRLYESTENFMMYQIQAQPD